MILIRPRYDIQTEYTYEWGNELIGRLEDQKPTDLAIDNAREHNLRSALSEVESPFVVFWGHGADDKLKGQDGSTLVGVYSGVLPAELSNRKLYIVACFAGLKLGPALTLVGCEFIGYTGRLFIPVEEKTRKAFGDLVNSALLIWIQTGSREIAVDALNRGWAKQIREAPERWRPKPQGLLYPSEPSDDLSEAYRSSSMARSNWLSLCSFP